MPPAPVKLLAYADDLLVLVNSSEELQAIQDHISCYGRASNSRVNYHKSVAFPLSGDKSIVQPDLFRLSRRLRFQWQDSNSLSYFQYLGYPIWFTGQQRDKFCEETIMKLQNSLNRHMTRNISVYGRAKMVNSLFLARFWHMLRITTLPLAFVRKISSMVYQFICHKIFPPVRKSIMYMPKEAGGLAVLDITVQQHILQQRYVRAILLDNKCDCPLPAFLLQILSVFLQVNYGSPLPHWPLLFRNYRYGFSLSGQHCLLPLLRSVDAFHVAESWDNCLQSLPTWLEFPFASFCQQDTTEPSIINNALIRQKPARAFLEVSRIPDSLVFKSRGNRQHPYLSNQITRAIHAGTLSLIPTVQIYLSLPFGHTGQGSATGAVDLSSYYHNKLYYQGNMVLSMTNSQLRDMYLYEGPALLSWYSPGRCLSFNDWLFSSNENAKFCTQSLV